MKFQNNALFWQKLESLFFSSELVIDRPKNSVHPKYANMIYPVDYGYLKDTASSDKNGIDVFVGSQKEKTVDYIVVAVDILKKDIEVKILWSCTEEEIKNILLFLNQSDYQKTILLSKGSEVPYWAES